MLVVMLAIFGSLVLVRRPVSEVTFRESQSQWGAQTAWVSSAQPSASSPSPTRRRHCSRPAGARPIPIGHAAEGLIGRNCADISPSTEANHHAFGFLDAGVQRGPDQANSISKVDIETSSPVSSFRARVPSRSGSPARPPPRRPRRGPRGLDGSGARPSRVQDQPRLALSDPAQDGGRGPGAIAPTGRRRAGSPFLCGDRQGGRTLKSAKNQVRELAAEILGDDAR